MKTHVMRCPTNVCCKVLSIIITENLSWENFDTYEITWRSGCTLVKQLIQVTSAFSSSETNNGTTTWYVTPRYIENPEYSTVKQVVM
jgi:hypothetical protein